MPDVLPASWRTEAERIHADQPFAWCWDFQLQLNASVHTRARLTGYPTPLTFDGKTFYPFPVKQAAIESTNEGDLPQITVSLSNHDRVLAPYFETVPEEEGIIGSVASGFLVNVDDLTTWQEHKFDVEACTLSDEWAILRLTAGTYLRRRVPQARYSQARCRFRFGTGTATHKSPCGYIINAFAAYATCNRTLSDCKLRGLDEAARNLPILHPRRWGGFNGIPEQ